MAAGARKEDKGGRTSVRPPGPLLHSAAVCLAEGWNVVPINRATKKAAREWKRLQAERLTDHHADKLERYLHHWWGDEQHDLGVVTGVASGLAVVDIDSDDAQVRLDEVAGTGWRTVCVRTRRGRHFYFRRPPAPRWMKSYSNVGGVEHFDVRCDGGIAVVPPSVGKQWVTTPWPFQGMPGGPVADMPEALVRFIWPEEEAPRSEPQRSGLFPRARSHGAGYAAAALRDETAKVAAAAEGVRNETLNRAAYALGRFVDSGELEATRVEGALLDAATRAGLPQSEAGATIRSGLGGRRR